ncbi:MAG: hypothetical protein ABSC04_10660 [Syntrophobacteraceae bacterium]|jgi:hypothetical protein
MERNLPGYEKNRSHYDDDAYARWRGYQTQWGTMEVDGCRVGKNFLSEISGHIDDFYIYWLKWTPGLRKGQFEPIHLDYKEGRRDGFKLEADLKISASNLEFRLEFRTHINEPSTQEFMKYLEDLDKQGLKVKDVLTKITITKVKPLKGRSYYQMTFQR